MCFRAAGNQPVFRKPDLVSPASIKSNRVVYAIAAISALLMMTAIYLANATRRAAVPTQGPAVTAVIRHNRYLMDVKNTDAFQWNPVTLCLNNVESGYFWEGDFKPGETKRIHLSDFARKDGSHFNPEKNTVGHITCPFSATRRLPTGSLQMGSQCRTRNNFTCAHRIKRLAVGICVVSQRRIALRFGK